MEESAATHVAPVPRTVSDRRERGREDRRAIQDRERKCETDKETEGDGKTRGGGGGEGRMWEGAEWDLHRILTKFSGNKYA